MLGGMLSAIKFSHTKNPKPGSPSRYAMFDLEDTEGMIRCIVWPDQFVHYERADQARRDRGRPRRGRQAAGQRGGQPDRQRDHPPGGPRRALHPRRADPHLTKKTTACRSSNSCTRSSAAIRATANWSLTLCLADGSRVACKCDDTRLAVNPEMQARVDQLLGPGNFRLLTSSPAAGSGGGGRGNGRGRR